MTLQEITELSNFPARTEEEKSFVNGLKIFLENHVCIPKGDNRHKNADVIHQWVEVMSIGLQYFDPFKNKFVDTKDCDFKDGLTYRIKPEEPVYEWQWIVYADDTHEPMFIGWATEEERRADTFWNYEGVDKLEKTKRVRK